jgi:hypothetical protein
MIKESVTHEPVTYCQPQLRIRQLQIMPKPHGFRTRLHWMTAALTFRDKAVRREPRHPRYADS